jgi:molybdopterin-synthase adenylyltransferase
VNDEDQEAADAGRPVLGNHQVGLSVGGGGSVSGGAAPPQLPAWRLKRSVEVFPASDGAIYLLRLGAGDDLLIAEPRPLDRRLLALLRDDYRTQSELRAAVQSAGLDPDGVAAAVADLEQAGVLERRSLDTAGLGARELARYDRQLIYFADLAEAGQSVFELQARLHRARVAVLGCGGLGCWVASGLACAGVGSLLLIDDDRVEISNLNRQLLFGEADIGHLKVEAAAKRLLAFNSQLEVIPVTRRVRGAADLQAVLEVGADLIVSTADWPPHELPRWVNEVSLGTGIPWIGAGQFPPRLRVGPLVVPGQSACLECLEAATRSSFDLYDELSAWRSRAETPDASVGPVTAVIGSLLASEAMQLILGARTPASLNHALLLDVETMRLDREEIVRQRSCPACREFVGPGAAALAPPSASTA